MRLPPGFHENPGSGRCPNRARGKRVVVILRNGRTCGAESVNRTSPPGWAADGKNGCRWSHSHPSEPSAKFDIMAYKVL